MADRDMERWMNEQDFEVRIPQFWPPGYALAECNRILDPVEQAEIHHAAFLMHNGYDIDAERHRNYAGYGWEARKADRAARGLPRRLPPTDPDDGKGYN